MTVHIIYHVTTGGESQHLTSFEQYKCVLEGYTVGMVTYCVTKMMTTCSTMFGQGFDTIIVHHVKNISYQTFCCVVFSRVVPYFDEPVGRVKIQTTSKSSQQYYTTKRLIRDLLSNKPNCHLADIYLPGMHDRSMPS